MKLGIENKVALVMGASSGLGYAIAKALKNEGVKVILLARDTERLPKATLEIGAAGFVSGDLLKPGESRRLVIEAVKKFGPIDILVTNAGGPPKGSFEDSTSEKWNEAFQGLWLSATDAIQEVLPSMKERKWGRILLVTSAAAKEPMSGLTLSNGLRAGLLGLTKSISNEVAAYGVTINALLPGYTDTERLQELKVPKEKILSVIPAGRLGRPDEFASLATYLASEQAGYISGQAIACDGGYLHGI